MRAFCIRSLIRELGSIHKTRMNERSCMLCVSSYHTEPNIDTALADERHPYKTIIPIHTIPYHTNLSLVFPLPNGQDAHTQTAGTAPH